MRRLVTSLLLACAVVFPALRCPAPVPTIPLLDWSGPTNSLALTNAYFLYTTSTDCAVTNFTGTMANRGQWATLMVSNSAGSAKTVRVTASGARFIGGATTNAQSVGAGKCHVISIIANGTGAKCVATAVEP